MKASVDKNVRRSTAQPSQHSFLRAPFTSAQFSSLRRSREPRRANDRSVRQVHSDEMSQLQPGKRSASQRTDPASTLGREDGGRGGGGRERLTKASSTIGACQETFCRASLCVTSTSSPATTVENTVVSDGVTVAIAVPMSVDITAFVQSGNSCSHTPRPSFSGSYAHATRLRQRPIGRRFEIASSLQLQALRTHQAALLHQVHEAVPRGVEGRAGQEDDEQLDQAHEGKCRACELVAGVEHSTLRSMHRI